MEKKFHYHGNRIRAIVFDVDDTLVITQEIFEKCFTNLIAQDGYDPTCLTEYINGITKGTARYITPLEKMLESLYPEASRKRIESWVANYRIIAQTYNYKPISDAPIFLEQCFPHVKLGFCTNEYIVVANHRLTTAELNPSKYFPEKTRRGLVLINGKTKGIRKPDKKALDYFVQLFKIKPEELLMVGDMKSDYLVAKNASTQGAVILTGIFSRDTMEKTTGNPGHVFDSLSQLMEHLVS